MGSQHFRAGVVIVVRHPDHQRVMAFERSDAAGSWQLPQGGLERGEEPLEAAWRELMEETGLGPDHVTPTAESADWIASEWPADLHSRHPRDGRRGQVHKWFVFDVNGDDVEPSPDGSEFTDWQWVTPDWLIENVVSWRRPVYEKGLGAL